MKAYVEHTIAHGQRTLFTVSKNLLGNGVTVKVTPSFKREWYFDEQHREVLARALVSAVLEESGQ